MPEVLPSKNGDLNGRSEPTSTSSGSSPLITAGSFYDSFGEDIRDVLDLATWRIGADMSREYSRIEREVREAVVTESSFQTKVRAKVFPRLKARDNAPKNAGKHDADRKLIEKIHQEFLFAKGGIEACDGSIHIHDALPLTIYQMGISLVSYQGNQGTWCQRLFRRDLQEDGSDRIEEVIAALERRQQRGESDGMGGLAQKALLDYAERAILLQNSNACWRMGHGNPITYELLTGGDCLELMVEATNVLRQLIEGYQKFVFVGHEPKDRWLYTIAQALQPMEFAIVHTLDERLEHWLQQNRYAAEAKKVMWDDEEIWAYEWIPRVIREVASQVVVGLFRATPVALAQMFYAHVDHADYAAHMVLADSVLQEHRGCPMLLDLARNTCDSVFGDSLERITAAAYAAAGAPWRYVNHRSSRG
ncbi:MAG: hypothetical protein HYX68_20185 [Planctomycetes bacterium]|nr:hypothetical protein [Planctomycetota bacterium]